MTLPSIPRWAPSVGLVLLAVAGLYWYGASERRIGAAKAAEARAKQEAKAAADSIAKLVAVRDSLARVAARADSDYRVTAAAAAGLAARYATLAHGLRRLVAAQPDTGFRGPATVLGQTLAACDSLAAAATDTMPCHARVAARDSVIRSDSLERDQHVAREKALKDENDAIRKQLPGWFNRTGGTVVKIAGTALVLCLLFGKCGL